MLFYTSRLCKMAPRSKEAEHAAVENGTMSCGALCYKMFNAT